MLTGIRTCPSLTPLVRLVKSAVPVIVLPFNVPTKSQIWLPPVFGVGKVEGAGSWWNVTLLVEPPTLGSVVHQPKFGMLLVPVKLGHVVETKSRCPPQWALPPTPVPSTSRDISSVLENEYTALQEPPVVFT